MKFSALLQSGSGSGSISKLATDASIFLIIGGLCMLGLVVVLVLLRTILPSGKPGSGGIIEGKLERHLAPTPTVPNPPAIHQGRPLQWPSARLEDGRRLGAALKPRNVDDIMDGMWKNGWGEPRLLRLLDDHAVIRNHACKECETTGQGCVLQAGYLEAAFSRWIANPVHVAEIRCRGGGMPACEFEVRFA